MAGCVFCSIVAGESPAFLVVDDPVAVALLDTRPLFPGHVLLIPRGHHETLTDLPPELVTPFFERVQRMAGVVQSAMGAAGTFVAINNTVSQRMFFLTSVLPRVRAYRLDGQA